MAKKKTPPRTVPSRDEKYMALAFCVAQLFSKDPVTQIGAVIVDEYNAPQGYGYNGPPKSMDDKEVDWSRPEKYDMVVHAEINAIYHSYGSLNGSTLYVTAPPCPRCMLEIIATGIERVVYFNLKRDSGSSINEEALAKIQMLANQSKIKLVEFSGNLNCIRDAVVNMAKMGVF
jgi:dCMP deaminase